MVAKRQVTPMVAIVARVERFDDAHQVNIVTGLGDPFRGNGASAGIDVMPHPRFMWRTEGRGFFADAPIFPDGTAAPRKSDGFVVSSFSLLF